MTEQAREQAAAQLASVRAMVAAWGCDFARLEELRDERDAFVVGAPDGTETPAPEQWAEENPSDADELAELEKAAGDCSDEDEARQRIEEHALSVEVRSDWATPGEGLTASEYRIVLCTGGPHVEIVGDLGRHGEPESALLLYQDWGTGKCEYICDGDEAADLLAYAGVFYLGE